MPSDGDTGDLQPIRDYCRIAGIRNPAFKTAIPGNCYYTSSLPVVSEMPILKTHIFPSASRFEKYLL